jgi:flagellar hook protein FlgE
MSLYGVMRTSVSGMSAQSNRLSAAGDNIANSSTTGYKRATTEFSTMVLQSGVPNYEPGGVNTEVRHSISEQGSLQFTTSTTDLAITGSGFFVVSDSDGSPYLTRAGSFVPDGSGNLVNASGYYLMGYSYADGNPTGVANVLSVLSVINIDDVDLQAQPSAKGTFSANLPSAATAVAAADLPSANAASAAYTAKTSLVAYDNLGAEVLVDVYLTKTSDNNWEMAVYNRADAPAAGGFPYAAGPLATQTLAFNPANGKLTSASPNSVSVPIPNGGSLALDLSNMTQLATGFTVKTAVVDGNAPSAIDSIEIGADGTLYSIYENGDRRATFRIPLANVPSPDNLTVKSGNIYAPSIGSGDVQVGVAGEAGFGTISSGALEGSTVDLATELTSMIESQRGYTANSKVFQTASDLLDVLVNLKR